MRRWLLLGGIGLFVVLFAALENASGVATAQDAARGEIVYQANCSSCHQPTGAGIPGSFPPLAGNPSAADAAYVESVVREGKSGPITVLGVDYNAVMPAVPLSDADVSDVVAFVATLAGESTTPPTAPPAAPVTGDAAVGKRLFRGAQTLANGGGSCHACHAAGTVDFRGGRGLGPDLTDVYDRFGGEAGLAAWLADPASPTMQPLFADHPLTEAEIADITAFLGTTTSQQPDEGIDQLFLAGVGGFLALLALMVLFIRGPQETYTQRLRRQRNE